MKRLLWLFFNVTKPLGKHAALAPAALQKVSGTPLEEETNGEDLWDSRMAGLARCLHSLSSCDTGCICVTHTEHPTQAAVFRLE